MYEIRNFDYNATIRQANNLENIGDEIRKLGSASLDQLLSRICASWKGEARTEFEKQMTLLIRSVTDQSDRVIRLAEEIRREANILKAAEEAAEREIQKKSKK